VRSLAMRSAKAAHDTATMIEDSVQNAEAGVEINREALKNLEGINEEVNLVSQVMMEIAEASDRQQKGMAELTRNMNQLEKMTQQYVSNSGQSIVASETLSGQAEAMQDLVATFQLSDGQAADAPGAPSDSGPARVNTKLVQDAVRWEY